MQLSRVSSERKTGWSWTSGKDWGDAGYPVDYQVSFPPIHSVHFKIASKFSTKQFQKPYTLIERKNLKILMWKNDINTQHCLYIKIYFRYFSMRILKTNTFYKNGIFLILCRGRFPQLQFWCHIAFYWMKT